MDDWVAFIFSFIFNFCVFHEIKMEWKVVRALRGVGREVCVDVGEERGRSQLVYASPCSGIAGIILIFWVVMGFNIFFSFFFLFFSNRKKKLYFRRYSCS